MNLIIMIRFVERWNEDENRCGKASKLISCLATYNTFTGAVICIFFHHCCIFAHKRFPLLWEKQKREKIACMTHLTLWVEYLHSWRASAERRRKLCICFICAPRWIVKLSSWLGSAASNSTISDSPLIKSLRIQYVWTNKWWRRVQKQKGDGK